ncbi:hypothetical protein NDU88_000398 [Pleurodeles waltl]|uniref:Uncharacterized protein n=1 Tax=Pleurodeles waltl TaxID=8319 RepID=A0AAV7TF18_PLEWA|nr:hypothetical protein NDU88_000398 [Pleurodeles waltl]
MQRRLDPKKRPLLVKVQHSGFEGFGSCLPGAAHALDTGLLRGELSRSPTASAARTIMDKRLLWLTNSPRAHSAAGVTALSVPPSAAKSAAALRLRGGGPFQLEKDHGPSQGSTSHVGRSQDWGRSDQHYFKAVHSEAPDT